MDGSGRTYQDSRGLIGLQHPSLQHARLWLQSAPPPARAELTHSESLPTKEPWRLARQTTGGIT